MSGEAWQDTNQPWREAWRWFFMSYLQAMAADGDGFANWFWPSVLLASVTSIAMGGFALVTGIYLIHPTDAGLKQVVDYILFALPWYAGFCAVDLVAWLGYRGWDKHMVKRVATNAAVETKTAMTMTSETKTPATEVAP